VLVDSLGDERSVIGFGAPRVDVSPADLRVALIVEEGQLGQSWMMLPDVVDDRHFPLHDAQHIRIEVFLVRAHTFLMHRDELQAHPGLSCECIRPAVTVFQKRAHHAR